MFVKSTPGLDPIPENDVPPTGQTFNAHSNPPLHTVLPLQVPKPVTTTYNISFPASTTLSQFGRDASRYQYVFYSQNLQLLTRFIESCSYIYHNISSRKKSCFTDSCI